MPGDSFFSSFCAAVLSWASDRYSEPASTVARTATNTTPMRLFIAALPGNAVISPNEIVQCLSTEGLSILLRRRPAISPALVQVVQESPPLTRCTGRGIRLRSDWLWRRPHHLES